MIAGFLSQCFGPLRLSGKLIPQHWWPACKILMWSDGFWAPVTQAEDPIVLRRSVRRDLTEWHSCPPNWGLTWAGNSVGKISVRKAVPSRWILTKLNRFFADRFVFDLVIGVCCDRGTRIQYSNNLLQLIVPKSSSRYFLCTSGDRAAWAAGQHGFGIILSDKAEVAFLGWLPFMCRKTPRIGWCLKE